MVDYMKAHPEKRILVLRTFSKYYAMAGLRVGYALGSEELIGIMRKCSASWNLNVCAQKAAVAGLADQEYYQEQKAKIVEEENIWKRDGSAWLQGLSVPVEFHLLRYRKRSCLDSGTA